MSDPGDNLTETITTNSTAGGGTLVNSFAYSYDANKNKLKETIGGPLNPYGFGTTVGQEAAYDAEDRVTRNLQIFIRGDLGLTMVDFGADLDREFELRRA